MNEFGTDYEGVAVAVGQSSGEEVILRWDVIGRAFDTLLRLAPTELRTPSEWLCKLYEQRRAICEFVKKENSTLNEEAYNAAQEIFKKRKKGYGEKISEGEETGEEN